MEQGFLDDETQVVQQIVRDRYSDWRELLLRLSKVAVANQHAIRVPLDCDPCRYAAVAYARTLSTTQGAVRLLEIGLVPQARTLLRAAMETMFALVALTKTPAFIDRLLEGHKAERRRIAGNVRGWEAPELKAQAEHLEASGALQSSIDSKAKKLTTFQVAEAAQLQEWYRGPYMVFSWSVHGAPADLDRHVVLSADKQVESLRNEPEIDKQESTWMAAIEILLMSTEALATLFSNVDRTQLEQINTEKLDLAKKSGLI